MQLNHAVSPGFFGTLFAEGIGVEHTIVMKAGGSGNMAEYDPPFQWLTYRRFQFNANRFRQIRDSLDGAAARARIVFITGGAGAYLFTGLARSLGVEWEAQQRAGCSVVRTLAQLLLDSQRVVTEAVCPYLVPAMEVGRHLSRFRIVFADPDPSLPSTDTLAAAIAANIPFVRLLFFKETVPVYHFLSDTPTFAPILSAQRILQHSQTFIPKPGDNFFLEREALSIMIEKQIPTWLYNNESLGQLPQIIDSPESVPHTRITYD